MCKGPGVGTGTARWLVWLEGHTFGKSEGNEVGGVTVTWGLMGLGGLWVLFCMMGKVLSQWITGSD